jgi:hypothetical protein
MDPVPPVTGVNDLTPAWCSAALAATTGGAQVIDVDVELVGTGQVADTARLRLTYEPAGAGPDTVVAKVPAADETSRSAARVTRTYEIEAGFYRDLAASLPVRTPHCHHAAHDQETDAYVVVLEDVAPAVQGDQMAGCSVDDIAAAVDELALLHGPRWGDESLESIGWLARGDNAEGIIALVQYGAGQFREHYAERLDADTNAVFDRLVPRLGDYIVARPRPWTIVHGDYRADNLLFGGERVVVVDWQTVGLGPGPADLSYLLGASLVPDDRRRHESALVDRYVAGLVAQGVEVDRDTVWEGYRRYAYGGLIMAIVASALVRRTDRGDEMFLTMAQRHAHQGLELDTEALYPRRE